MPKRTKVCRVCGKTYESCRTAKTGSGIFNWREMCCSPECGQIYFKRINEARNPVVKVKEKKANSRRAASVKEAPVVVGNEPMVELVEPVVKQDDPEVDQASPYVEAPEVY